MDGGNAMAREHEYHLAKSPTGPHPTMAKTVDAMTTVNVSDDVRQAAATLGVPVETFIRLFAIGSRVAVVETRQDDGLRVAAEVGKLKEQLSSITGTMRSKQSAKEVLYKAIAAFLAAISLGMGTVMATCGSAYQDARVDAAIPAVAAKTQAEILDGRVADHDESIEAMKSTMAVLSDNVTDLQKAVVALTAKLPDPDRSSGQDDHVPASTSTRKKVR